MGISASDRRQQLFHAGAGAFSCSQPDVIQSRPDVAGWYVCPLCLHAFPPVALTSEPPRLTLDETPPRASTRGPITKVLTCRPCNNEAGRWLEGDLKKRRVVEDFGAGRLARPIDIQLEAGNGTRVPAKATFIDGQLQVIGVPTATPPKDIAAHWGWWDKQVDEAIPESQFRIHMAPYSHGRSQTALLKAGYLAAFAAFGYTYIFRPELDPVRKEISDPGGGHMRQIPVLTHRGQDPTTHRILSATEPLGGLFIQIGQDFVLLPWMNSEPGFWDRVGELIIERVGTITFDGAGDWPRFPQYRLDHPETNP